MTSAIVERSVGLLLLASLLMASGELGAAQEQEKQTGCQALLDRWKQTSVVPLPDWRAHPVGEFRGEATDLDASAWETIQGGKEWGARSIWLRRWVEVPASRNGYDFRRARVWLRLRFGGTYPVHLIVYLNGTERAQGDELAPVLLTASAGPGEKIFVAVKAQVAGGLMRFGSAHLEMEIPSGRPDPRLVLEECVSAELLNASAASGQPERAQVLGAARKAIDWSALEAGDQRRFDASLDQAREKLEPLRAWLKSYSISAVGNSHIDMAWLWPWTETVEVVRDTFSSILELMQDFPDFKFAHSSAQTYAWMEEKYPPLFEAIRERVREGRWELVGGMWVEPDLNMPSGESQVRQLLIGKRYFKEKFGKDIRIGWNPDSFGYNWQLPQIYRKSGVDFFVTQKLGWNDTTKFPYKLFWWEAPDGSRVLTYFPHDYVNSIDAVRMAADLGAYTASMGFPQIMHLYGVGDHGGGPTRRMLEAARSWQAPSVLYPNLTLTTAQAFFDQVAPKLEGLKLPVWRSELYLEYHRGVFTTQAETKKNNRRSESLLLDAEKFSSLASLLGQPYPQANLNAAWHKVLFNQFHDVLSGTGIPAVYRDADRDYAEVRRIGQKALRGALDALSARIRTEGPGVPVLVFNSLSWPRADVVEAEVSFPAPVTEVEVRDLDGRPALAEIFGGDPATRTLKVRFLAEGVPSLGYKVYRFVPVTRPRPPASSLVAHADLLENEFLRVRVDPKTGCLTSLFDKKSAHEVLAPGACGNLLQTFRDKPRDWDAWNIDADFEDQKWDLTEAQEVRLVESGPLRAVLRVTKKFQNSTFVQNITLYSGIPRLDVNMEADWHEKHILLKVAFPLAVRSDFATFEIPYGSIERPTTRRTPEEKARFEVPALRWADLSDAGGGMSLLNDCKYGYDAKDNVLRLTLLRSPEWPDPHADEGKHSFTYSLYPHAAGWKQAGTVRRGYELNNRLLAIVAASHQGSLPPVHSFVQLEPDNLVLTAVKKAEDNDGLIFRFYEFAGRQVDARLRLPPGATRASETNLMENEERELPVQNGLVILPTRPYEIKCIKVRFAPAAQASSAARHVLGVGY